MGASDKMDKEGERLKEFDAALKHIDDRLAIAAEELAARVTDQASPARARRQLSAMQPAADPDIKAAL